MTDEHIQQPLFRMQAMTRQTVDHHSGIIIVHPLSFAVVAMAATVIAVTVLALLFFGTYTQRTTAHGELAPQRSAVRVFAPRSGIVIRQHVEAGQYVQQGAPLYVIAAEPQGLLQRDAATAIYEELAGVRSSLASELALSSALDSKRQRRLAEIDHSIARTMQQLRQSDTGDLVVTAPESGTVTALAADVGQPIDARRALVNIMPDDAELEARFSIASGTAESLQKGDLVRLRYPAYRHRQADQLTGTIISIAKAAPDTDIATAPRTQSGGARPLPSTYRLTVELPAQEVIVDGKRQRLRAGMPVEAVVAEDTRRLYQWVFGSKLHAGNK